MPYAPFPSDGYFLPSESTAEAGQAHGGDPHNSDSR